MCTVLRSAFGLRKSLDRKAGTRSVGDPQPLVVGFWSEVDWWQNKSKTKQNKTMQSKIKQNKTKQIKTQQNPLQNNQNHLQKKKQTRCGKKKTCRKQNKLQEKQTKQNRTTPLF